MTALGFPAATFDVAACAFGLFFVEDMETQLAHVASAVKPGGTVMVTSFDEAHYFHPLRELMLARLGRHGVVIPPPTWRRIGNERACAALFDDAGLADARVEARNVGYFLDGAEGLWDVVWNAGFRRLLGQLSSDDLERFKREHLKEVETLVTNDGLWLDVGVLYTFATRPA